MMTNKTGYYNAKENLNHPDCYEIALSKWGYRLFPK